MRLASFVSSGAGPARRSGTRQLPASQAPSSIALQSCSPPAKGTRTGPGAATAFPTATATSHGAERRSSASSGSSSAPPPDETSTRSASCSVASRARSAPGERLVNTAALATTPSATSRSHSVATAAAAAPSSSRLAISRATISSRAGSRASGAATARSCASDWSPTAPARIERCRVRVGARSSELSWRRIAPSSSCNIGDGAMPSSSTSARRVRRYTPSASAWRPDR